MCFVATPRATSARRVLLPDCAARSLAGARVGAGALAAGGQATTVAQATVGAEVHQSLDADADFTAQIAFHAELRHFATQVLDLTFGQRLDLCGRVHARRLADLARTSAADAVDALQADPNVLVDRQVDARDTCHVRLLHLKCVADSANCQL